MTRASRRRAVRRTGAFLLSVLHLGATGMVAADALLEAESREHDDPCRVAGDDGLRGAPRPPLLPGGALARAPRPRRRHGPRPKPSTPDGSSSAPPCASASVVPRSSPAPSGPEGLPRSDSPGATAPPPTGRAPPRGAERGPGHGSRNQNRVTAADRSAERTRKDIEPEMSTHARPWIAALSILFGVVTATPLQAQQGRIEGVVMVGTSTVDDADVALPALGRRVATDGAGRFVVRAHPTGIVRHRGTEHPLGARAGHRRGDRGGHE